MEELRCENWIWLDPAVYPSEQRTYSTFFSEKNDFRYCVAEFKRAFSWGKPIERVTIRVSGDTCFRLYLNGTFVGEGPVKEVNDFFDTAVHGERYASSYTVFPKAEELDFYAEVQLSPVRMNDNSRGHGGFVLSAEVLFANGEVEYIYTDESWLSRIEKRRPSPFVYNSLRDEDEWIASCMTENIWHMKDSPIPMLSRETIKPVSEDILEIKPNTEQTFDVYFDKIYAAHVALEIECEGACEVTVKCYERSKDRYSSEEITVNTSNNFESIQIHSIGAYEIKVSNRSRSRAVIKPQAIAVCYPVEEEGYFKCSDADINRVFEACKWATRICRQTMHLDSPLHQEPLACTGDYYIESLISAFCFGDMRLSELDVVRTAQLISDNHGKMFHTTYSLIWVQMLYEVYMLTGNEELLRSCEAALHILLERFNGYAGKNGLIEDPPNYMFIDWVVQDGYSLHHPPKALGQTSLNAFYYGALITASEICGLLADKEHEKLYKKRAAALKTAFNDSLFDEERQLYFDGMNTTYEPNEWLPQNSAKRYYSKQSNTLSVLYGLCDGEKAADVMRRVATDKTLIDVQPYFMHFVLCALRKVGLFDEYGFDMLNKWKQSVTDFGKGLQEGWLKPEEGYIFDYSHAWGGTPAYQLVKELLGLELIEPGYKRIRLVPKLGPYKYVYISIPTPFGYITCNMRKDRAVQISVPSEIKYTMEQKCRY